VKGHLSPAADGPYGIENADQDCWTGSTEFMTFRTSLPGEDSPQQKWRSKGKWIAKGVLGQLNEESFESGSSIKG